MIVATDFQWVAPVRLVTLAEAEEMFPRSLGTNPPDWSYPLGYDERDAKV